MVEKLKLRADIKVDYELHETFSSGITLEWSYRKSYQEAIRVELTSIHSTHLDTTSCMLRDELPLEHTSLEEVLLFAR
jgi:hypothetical protein